MILKMLLGIVAAVVLVSGFSSCAVEGERKPVLPGSDDSVLPWNGLREGEAQGQFGAFQRG